MRCRSRFPRLALRDGRMVVLTEFGKLMQDKLGRVVDARRKAEVAAEQFLTPNVTKLDVGIMCTIGPATLVGLLDRFRIENPGIDLSLHDVTPSSGYGGLQNSTLDCAVMAINPGMSLPEGFKSRVLYQEKMVVAFSPEHRFNMAAQVAFDELDGERYIDRLHCEFRDMFLDQVKSRGLELSFPFASEREDWIQSMIAGELGVCLLPEFMIGMPGIRTRCIIDPPLERSVRIAYRPGHENSHGLMALLDQADRMPWPVTGETWRDHTSHRV